MSRPSAWETTTLGEACEKPQYGFTASAETRDTGTRFLRITDLREGDLKWNEVPFCKCLEHEIDRYQLKTGDLFVARIGATTGRTSLVISPPKAVFASYLIRLRPKADMNPFFVYFFTQSSAYWSSINSSKDSNLKGGVNAGVLTRIEIPKPSKTEQEKIAAVLWKVQKAVAIEDAIVRNARDLKKSLLRHLFTHGLRGAPLKETEIGPLPESWEVIPFEQVLTMAQYGLSLRGQSQGRYPILRMNCQSHGQVTFQDLQFVDLDEKAFAAYELRDGDLLFNRTNSFELVGRTAIFHSDKPAVFASYLIRLRLDTEEMIPDFVNYYLNMESTQQSLKLLATRAVSQSNISASKLKTFQIPKPEKDEQREIANILQTIDRKIDIHESKKRSLQDLFKTTLHKLMTAQIRVNNLDIDASEVSE